MYLDKVQLVFLTLSLHAGSSQVYFSTPEFYLHANLDTTNITSNVAHFEKVILQLTNTAITFHNRRSIDKDHNILVFHSWLETEAEMCVNELVRKKKIINFNLKNAFPISFENHVRVKRGFKPLGTLISWITDLPSPASWQDEQLSLQNNHFYRRIKLEE